jgi:hypothetical protein
MEKKEPLDKIIDEVRMWRVDINKWIEVWREEKEKERIEKRAIDFI